MFSKRRVKKFAGLFFTYMYYMYLTIYLIHFWPVWKENKYFPTVPGMFTHMGSEYISMGNNCNMKRFASLNFGVGELTLNHLYAE